jgi:carboxyl-terminal processing protease
MSFRTRLIVLGVSTPILAFAVIGGFLDRADAREDTTQHLRVFEDVISLIMNNYVEVADFRKVMSGAMTGLADGLDPDSSYLHREEVTIAEQSAAPTGAGIGLEMTRQYYLRVVATRDNSPAARAGLATGDYIRAIDGRPTRDMSLFTGTRLLRGAPGSKVSLTVLRGSAAEPHVVDLIREREKPAEPTARISAPGVGYVRVPAFSDQVAAQLRSQIDGLVKQGATHVLIDLRRTATGPLDAGIAAARLFVPSGTLVIREARTEPRQVFEAAQGDGRIQTPVTLLVSNGTSGAAELFAAALAGNKRAELVGEHTLGRAALQKLVKLPDGSGLWLSWARYLGPDGQPIHGKGLAPTVEVEEPDVDFGASRPTTDPILQKALDRVAVKRAA